jgi:hypothetical protein
MSAAPETTASPAKNRLTYSDLLHLEWIIDDKIEEWKWRDDGLDSLVEKGQSVLERIRAMIREDEQIGDSVTDGKGGGQ